MLPNFLEMASHLWKFSIFHLINPSLIWLELLMEVSVEQKIRFDNLYHKKLFLMVIHNDMDKPIQT